VILGLVALAVATSASTAGGASAGVSDRLTRLRVSEIYGKIPLSFEENQGQVAPPVKFLARGGSYALFFSPDEVAISLRGGAPQTELEKDALSRRPVRTRTAEPPQFVRMRFPDANQTPQILGLQKLPSQTNYFIGSDPAKWRTGVANYARVQYRNVYPGVDVVFYGTERQLEYDLVLAPGVDPSVIRLTFQGADDIEVDARGDLVLHLEEGDLRQHRPVTYQEIEGERRTLEARYVLTGTRQVGIRLANYDASQTLIIDPVLSYSTYLGGNGADQAFDIALDASGNSYVTGITNSPNFPTQGPVQSATGGLEEVFVTKLNAAGSALVYSTYLGGSGNDDGLSIAVDSAGNAYVTGSTTSANFPTRNPIQATYRGTGDVFVTKLNAAGSALVYSTYLGGSDQDAAFGIAVDSAGNAYVTGGTLSTNFPTQNALQPASGGFADAFATKINAAGSALVYSTYLGGTGNFDDQGFGIAVDGSGNAYVAGRAASPNFPTRNPIQPAFGGGVADAFATKLNAAGSALVYSTYLGGTAEDGVADIAIDGAGNAYVAGLTKSANFPTQSPLQSTNRGGTDAFVTKLNAAGSALTYSTYLGGTDGEGAAGIAVDTAGNAYVTGATFSVNFPVQNQIQPPRGSVSDAFISKFNPAGSALLYSTYLGGGAANNGRAVAVDAAGNAYVTGWTTSTDFPTHTPLQATYGGGAADAFVTKIALADPPTITTSCPLPGATSGTSYSQTLSASGGTPPYTWSVSTGALPPGLNLNFSSGVISGTPTTAGTFNLTIQVTDGASGVATKACSITVASGPPSGSCTPGTNALCLNNSRFRVQVGWRVPAQGTIGIGTAVPITTDTGYFWFFSSNNLELVIKVLDGRSFNGKFWVFYGALSNVEYTISVTDTTTGAVKSYFNQNGNLASVADVTAF